MDALLEPRDRLERVEAFSDLHILDCAPTRRTIS